MLVIVEGEQPGEFAAEVLAHCRPSAVFPTPPSPMMLTITETAFRTHVVHCCAKTDDLVLSEARDNRLPSWCSYVLLDHGNGARQPKSSPIKPAQTKAGYPENFARVRQRKPRARARKQSSVLSDHKRCSIRIRSGALSCSSPTTKR